MKLVPTHVKEDIVDEYDLSYLEDPAKMLRFLLAGKDAEQIVAEAARYKDRKYVVTYAGKTLTSALRGAIKDTQIILANRLPDLVDKSLNQVEQVLDSPMASRQDKLKAANLVIELAKFAFAHQRKVESRSVEIRPSRVFSEDGESLSSESDL